MSPVAELRNRRALLVAIVACAALALWWWWPYLVRDPERVDVVVLGDGQVAEARDPLERRIRETGRSVRTLAAPVTWCDAVAQVVAETPAWSPSVVVVSVRAADPACSGFASAGDDGWRRLVEAARPARVVLVVQPGPVPAGQPREVVEALRLGGGWIVADPTELLGEEGEARLPCQWWDDCEGDGTVQVRDGGRLTPAGGERLARVVAAVLP